MNADPRRALPKVDLLLAHPDLAGRVRRFGRGPVLGIVRRVLESSRRDLAGGGRVPGLDELAARVAGELDAAAARRMRAVVNATGVVLHTNLGRAPLPEAARAAVLEAAGYATVEYDLATGRRGRRGTAAEVLLCEATGAPAGLVVNNAAGALLLALNCLARGLRVVVSRGELIEIGGEFRLPAIMEAAGVTLVEVGTTNRTHLHDYARALDAGEATGCVLTVHPSNYRVEGFATSPALDELAALAHERGLPLLYDLGSGLLDGAPGGFGGHSPAAGTTGSRPHGGCGAPRWVGGFGGHSPAAGTTEGPSPGGSGVPRWLASEPTATGSLAAGADLVVFSGDKLLGGPQAGLVVGRADLVGRLARHPVARAVRADKLTIAALEATLAAHVAGRRDELPVWRALLLSPEDLRPRAAALAAALGPAARLRDGVSVAGGGSLPGEGLPSVLVEVEPGPAGEDALLARLREGDPPMVARAEHGRVVLDLRTVPPDQDELVTAALRRALTSDGPGGSGGTVPRPEPPPTNPTAAAGPPDESGGSGGTVPRPEPPPANPTVAAGPPDGSGGG
jgi:L-seryl-tRNA(Ser) seleniumtransferase